jgi:xylitol oxidase
VEGESHVRNWAGNVAYSARGVARPADLDGLCRSVADNAQVKALGSRHSFNDSADTVGIQVSLEDMPAAIDIDAAACSVSSSAGVSHADLSLALHHQGLAMPNLASLPHISVGGAIQTGTHGSGARNPALSAAVTSVEIVDAEGAIRRVGKGHDHFDAVVVGLGAFGVVHAVTQDVVASFEVEQRVVEGVPWAAVLPALEDVMACAYSVSLFSRFDHDRVDQVWVKRRVSDPPAPDLTALGGAESAVPLHPVPGTPADNVNEQLGVPGPSFDRLPHFRSDFRPGQGDELQSEYFVDAERGAEALEAVRRLSSVVSPILHIGEIRRIAPDPGWLSPSGNRDSLALHFTWRAVPREVDAALPVLESALLPLGARPHWGKLFACSRAALLASYPRLDDFAALVREYDPRGKFDNAFLGRILSDRGRRSA